MMLELTLAGRRHLEPKVFRLKSGPLASLRFCRLLEGLPKRHEETVNMMDHCELFPTPLANFKSKQACITALAPGNVLNAEKMLIHPLSWSSTRIIRVRRITLMTEAHAPPDAVEHGLRTRATIVDMRGQLDIRQWEETASAAMGHVWFTDCERLFENLISPNTKQVHNKRLADEDDDFQPIE